jgi:hypothetical protein
MTKNAKHWRVPMTLFAVDELSVSALGFTSWVTLSSRPLWSDTCNLGPGHRLQFVLFLVRADVPLNTSFFAECILRSLVQIQFQSLRDAGTGFYA